jgi:hypothetical protein
MQTHLGAHARERLGQEVGPPHPGLDRAEGMLDRLSSYAHHLRLPIQPQVHRLAHRFMFPARNAPIVARGASRLERTPRANLPMATWGERPISRARSSGYCSRDLTDTTTTTQTPTAPASASDQKERAPSDLIKSRLLVAGRKAPSRGRRAGVRRVSHRRRSWLDRNSRC